MTMDVKEDADGLTLTITTDKRVNPFVIYKPTENGFSMFKIKYENNSPVPEKISGYYTSRVDALKDLKFFIEHVEPTKDKVWADKYKDVSVPELKTKPVKKDT